jgi:hypothetical protein
VPPYHVVLLVVATYYTSNFDYITCWFLFRDHYSCTEPRKIAHRILNAREDVATEMINDLGCIALENDEVQRYAGVWAKEGREAAEKSRKVTRVGQGSATPLRDRNYLGLNVFVSCVSRELH